MNKIEFENALMSTIVDYISDQIVLRYMQACKTATVLFSGALIGYGDAVAALEELKKDGWKLTVVMSKAAAEVITEERIKNDIDPEAIFVEGAPVNGRQIIDDNQFVIIPALTINTAAKVANCINDNLLTNMIYRAMTQGKPIVAAVDGCCPDNEVRQQLGFKVTEAYKARLRSNLEAMKSYGIHLTVDRNLFRKVDEAYTASFEFPIPDSESEVMQEEVKGESLAIAADSVKLDNRVIGRTDIARNAFYKKIIVRSDAVVTGLASDEASNRGIVIARE